MLNHSDIMSTVDMIDHQHLDIRTITMGISLLDCADPNPEACARKVHDKICRQAEHLVATGCQIERELGIPIVNKRISVTPIALVASACETEDFVPFAKAMDSAAKTCGVDFIGGFSALVQKGMASGDRRLIAAIPQALAETELVCSSVNVASTKAGINMDAVRLMGQAIKKTAELTKERDGLGCAKLQKNRIFLFYFLRTVFWRIFCAFCIPRSTFSRGKLPRLSGCTGMGRFIQKDPLRQGPQALTERVDLYFFCFSCSSSPSRGVM